MTSLEARTFGVELYDHWTALWNLDLRRGPHILGSRVLLRYAQPGTEAMDNVHTSEAFVAFIETWHMKRAGMHLRFYAVGEACVDLQPDSMGFSGLVSRPYEASFQLADVGPVRFGGTDTLRVTQGRISEVWSVSAGQHGRCFYRV